MPMACPRCTQTTSCVNTCEKCEVCLGRPAPTDPSCFPDGGTPSGTDGGGDWRHGGTPVDAATDGMVPPAPMCGPGIISCGPGGQVAANGCDPGYYCQTGCCVRFVID